MDRASANNEFYSHAGYVSGIKVNGMDSVTAWVRSYALKNGPLVIKMKRYRYFGHSMSDQDTMRHKRDNIKTMYETCDCILFCKRRWLELGATEDKITAVEDRARDLDEKQATEAKVAPPADIILLVNHLLTSELQRCFFSVFFSCLINEPSRIFYL